MTPTPCQCPFLCAEHPREVAPEPCDAYCDAIADACPERCVLSRHPFAYDDNGRPCRCAVHLALDAAPAPPLVSGVDAVAAPVEPVKHDACPVCERPGWLPAVPRVEVVSEGPPKRSLAEIMRDPPRLTLDPQPPAKPTQVEVGQRWQYETGGRYTVVSRRKERWTIRWDGGAGEDEYFSDSILCDKYIGTVPVPASAPRGLTAGEESALNAAKQYAGPSVGCGAPVSTPAGEVADPETCAGRAKVKRHPGEGYDCGLHPAPAVPAPGAGVGLELTFAELTDMNQRRCQSWHGFNESLQPGSKFTVAHWALMVTSEVGEIADAILGWEGLKERRKDKTKADVGKEIADAIILLDLLAYKLGFQTGDLVLAKFNEVNQRAGFGDRFTLRPGANVQMSSHQRSVGESRDISTAREIVHRAFKTATSRAGVAPFCCMLDGKHPCGVLCDTLTAAVQGMAPAANSPASPEPLPPPAPRPRVAEMVEEVFHGGDTDTLTVARELAERVVKETLKAMAKAAHDVYRVTPTVSYNQMVDEGRDRAEAAMLGTKP